MKLEKGQEVKVIGENGIYHTFKVNDIVSFTGSKLGGTVSETYYEFVNSKGERQYLSECDFELVTNNSYISDYLIKADSHGITIGGLTFKGDGIVHNIYNEVHFKPSDYKLNKNVLSIYLKDGEFKVVVKRKVLTFAEEFSNKITYDLLTRKITNTQDKFLFKDEEDNEHTYFLHQIVSFQNVKHLIDEYASKFENNKEVVLSSEYNVEVSKAAEDLNAEIMEFHMDVLVNKYLDEGNFDALDELFNG